VVVYFLRYPDFSKSQENILHLARVLDSLRNEKLYIKLKKCAFLVPAVHFFGFIVSRDSVAVNLNKVKAIRE